MSKRLTISLVIPVYNEESHLGACLQSAVSQLLPFDEIIVVDNNSTDATSSVAVSVPGVHVIHEARQGVVHSRNRGFDSAAGDIIARIDADTILPPDWSLRVARTFAESDMAAVTGSISYYDLPQPKFFGAVDLVFRRYAAFRMKNEVFLQGANMALRKSVWEHTKARTCTRAGLHEDFDLAIHIQQARYRIAFVEEIHASISARCINDSVKSFWSYVMLNPKTYAQHSLKSGRHMYPLVTLALLFHLPLRVLYRGYDAENKRFSWRNAFRTNFERINPATFVD